MLFSFYFNYKSKKLKKSKRNDKKVLRQTNYQLMERLKQIWKNYKEISPYFSSQRHKLKVPAASSNATNHNSCSSVADNFSSCSDIDSCSLLFYQQNKVKF
jgi:hypothetical protein